MQLVAIEVWRVGTWPERQWSSRSLARTGWSARTLRLYSTFGVYSGWRYSGEVGDGEWLSSNLPSSVDAADRRFFAFLLEVLSGIFARRTARSAQCSLDRRVGANESPAQQRLRCEQRPEREVCRPV